MRRSLAWLIAVPLMLGGSQLAHALAYRIAYPQAHVRVVEQQHTARRQPVATGAPGFLIIRLGRTG